MTHNKRWVIAKTITQQASEALAVVPPILRQVLFNRGIGTEEQARAFVAAKTLADTNPFQMIGMQAAVDRIRFALNHNEPIAIYGDYDVDGVTATALLVEALQKLGGSVRGYIPNRFDEGYGLNKDALDSLKADGVKLVITVDCGIRSPDETLHARAIGLDLIISDHHHPDGDNLPPAFAVINPKQHGDPYPDKDLAGVGIAYKIVEGLMSKVEGQTAGDQLTGLLDLVALGTVADLAPLVGENRSLVRNGLKQLRETKRQGLFSLAGVASVDIKKINAGNIGFMLGPRLNASGRLESALASFELLTTTDFMRAGQLAQQLDVQNRQRQTITKTMQQQAEEIAMQDDPNAFLLFAAHEEFNSGVVGLAASRLTEKYYRPSVVAAKGELETRGSCRSIPEFHITDALDQCKDLLVRHGGHAAAAGFTVKNQNLHELVARLKSIAKEKLEGKDLRQILSADMEVPLADMNFGILKNIAFLEPTGYGNPDAIFVSRNVKVKAFRAVGSEGRHLKLTLEDGPALKYDAIGFRMGDMAKSLPPRVDVMYTLEANEYNGRTSLQLNLKDVKEAGVVD
ncbi:MAG TPA: single-stranded-DNA-specific exonuclease RecJ [Anaerolineales bacterium]|jgi:single-stranded-DNA-specific exonuclease|nr:single-stranded-DNA-specific exonuclease RecJ [Anaerolineales bacterium]HQX15129.1 single-stranded-DNA-specific exonuclease RecJ [Anaerolineales bacterium]